MRRNEIVIAVRQGIKDHFPEDVVPVFHPDDMEDLDNIGRLIQDERDPRDANEVVSLIEDVAAEASGRDLDALADGHISSPKGWLYNKIKDHR